MNQSASQSTKGTLRSQQQAQLPEAIAKPRLPLHDAKLACLAFAVVALITCVGFMLMTGQVGDSFRAMQMLAESHRPGSPGLAQMGNAMPAPIEASVLRGLNRAFGPTAIWGWRCLQLLAFLAGGCTLIWAIVAGPELERSRSRTALILTGIYLAISPLLVMLVAGGASTGFLVLAAALGYLALRLGMEKGWLILGLSAALLWYVHPLGLVLGGAMFIAAVGMTDDSRVGVLWQVVKAAILAVLLIGPGLFLADWRWWWGPDNLLAQVAQRLHEASGSQPMVVTAVEQLAAHLLPTARATMSPAGAALGGWQAWVAVMGLVVGCLGLAYWLMPLADRAGRLASLIFTLVCFYLAIVLWLTPVGMVGGRHLVADGLALALPFGLIVLALAPMRLAKASRCGVPVRAVAVIFNAVLIAGMSLVLGHVMMQQRVYNVVIQGRAHDDMATWLAEHVAPGDRVLLQAGPNMAYRLLLAGRPTDDEALRALLRDPEPPTPWQITTLGPQTVADNVADRIAAELPDWVVLPRDVAGAVANRPRLAATYERVHEIDERANVDRWSQGQMGRPVLHREAQFVAMRRVQADEKAEATGEATADGEAVNEPGADAEAAAVVDDEPDADGETAPVEAEPQPEEEAAAESVEQP